MDEYKVLDDNIKTDGDLEVKGDLVIHRTTKIINNENIVQTKKECKSFTKTDVELFNEMKNRLEDLEEKLERYQDKLEFALENI